MENIDLLFGLIILDEIKVVNDWRKPSISDSFANFNGKNSANTMKVLTSSAFENALKSCVCKYKYVCVGV